MVFMLDAARIPIAGNFDPFMNENQSHSNKSLPSLDLIHNHVHRSSETNDTHSISNNTRLEEAGPSLDLIDSHAHDDHDDDDASVVEIAKRLIQPSIDFLDAQLHDGDEHAHNDENHTNEKAADLNDFQNWLKEQNQTDQLQRFLLLQKEINQFALGDKQDLNNKLNRTIEELKSTIKNYQERKHDL
ncbi:unnamed protein product [Adineta steineri]|uniref:Uncharacterized protein n=1 Tax=Adineta steineri TaxID=433720 RepID=A0A813Z8D3_9BILA|nr:unnamed protein product [Adineta steineri]CAF1239428.1 unnamed protein product [Adineta steineri]